MSHIVTIQTTIHDPAAATAACRRLGLAEQSGSTWVQPLQPERRDVVPRAVDERDHRCDSTVAVRGGHKASSGGAWSAGFDPG